ncbi:hypothetical protein ANN_09134 [Periplaneta americana]|uniref:Reverse transcriptase domain-containing protein n=1 Tax=Periplaneta americana TaxID=6978 RepID=A0ABQ8TKI3_PERAM|nr:hypothetical protein ANN_09134 [Periplaneta americana]
MRNAPRCWTSRSANEQDDPRQRPNWFRRHYCKIFELDACQGIGKAGSPLYVMNSAHNRIRVLRSPSTTQPDSAEEGDVEEIIFFFAYVCLCEIVRICLFSAQNQYANIERELILKLTFEYAIGKVQDNREGLQLNGLHQLLVYADDVTMLGENLRTIRERTGILLEASKEIDLEVNPEKTKYMIMSRDENIVRNGNIKIGDLCFEEVEKLKYLGATVTK